MKQGHASGGKN
jgi:hypothetical protein